MDRRANHLTKQMPLAVATAAGLFANGSTGGRVVTPGRYDGRPMRSADCGLPGEHDDALVRSVSRLPKAAYSDGIPFSGRGRNLDTPPIGLRALQAASAVRAEGIAPWGRRRN